MVALVSGGPWLRSMGKVCDLVWGGGGGGRRRMLLLQWRIGNKSGKVRALEE